jgi:hypothetical protein
MTKLQQLLCILCCDARIQVRPNHVRVERT